MKRSRRFQLQF